MYELFDQEIENEYVNEQVQQLRQFYEAKHGSLYETIQQAYEKIVRDDLLSVMKKNPISAEFVQQRAQELFEQIVGNEREIFIEKLGGQVAAYKSQCKKFEALCANSERQRKSLESELRQLEGQLTETQRTQVQTEQKLLQQVRSLEQQLSFETENTQKNGAKFKEKVDAYKKKLTQYKDKNTNLDKRCEELLAQVDRDNKQKDSTIGILEQQLTELQEQYEQKISEMIETYESRMVSLQYGRKKVEEGWG